MKLEQLKENYNLEYVDLVDEKGKSKEIKIGFMTKEKAFIIVNDELIIKKGFKLIRKIGNDKNFVISDDSFCFPGYIEITFYKEGERVLL